MCTCARQFSAAARCASVRLQLSAEIANGRLDVGAPAECDLAEVQTDGAHQGAGTWSTALRRIPIPHATCPLTQTKLAGPDDSEPASFLSGCPSSLTRETHPDARTYTMGNGFAPVWGMAEWHASRILHVMRLSAASFLACL